MLKRFIASIFKRFRVQLDKPIRKTVPAFINDDIWDESKCLVMVQCDLLLSNAINRVLTNLLTQYGDNYEIGAS